MLAREAERLDSKGENLEAHLALILVGSTRIGGVEDSLRTILKTEHPPYWTAVRACRALEGVPDREAAEGILSYAITKPVFYPRFECAQSLVGIVGGRAAPAVEKAIEIETDKSTRRMLQALL